MYTALHTFCIFNLLINYLIFYFMKFLGFWFTFEIQALFFQTPCHLLKNIEQLEQSLAYLDV